MITTASNGQVIPKAALPAGSVLQVVSANHSTATTTTSTSYVDTGLSASITPTSATSKILVIVSQNLAILDGISSGTTVSANIVRGATQIAAFTTLNIRFPATHAVSATHSLQAYDSPASTSSLTYKTQLKSDNGGSVVSEYSSSTAVITLMEIAA
jgi:hypothetical protein